MTSRWSIGVFDHRADITIRCDSYGINCRLSLGEKSFAFGCGNGKQHLQILSARANDGTKKQEMEAK